MATKLYQLKRYLGVVDTVSHALALYPGRIRSTTGLTEGVYAPFFLGREEDARNLLNKHISANPNWRKSKALRQIAPKLDIAN